MHHFLCQFQFLLFEYNVIWLHHGKNDLQCRCLLCKSSAHDSHQNKYPMLQFVCQNSYLLKCFYLPIYIFQLTDVLVIVNSHICYWYTLKSEPWELGKVVLHFWFLYWVQKLIFLNGHEYVVKVCMPIACLC